MAGFLDRAREALRGAVPGLFRSKGEAQPDWVAGRARLLLIGPTGAGKSALVNALLGEGTAPSGAGAPVTEGTAWYGQDASLPVAIGDTRGLEAAESAGQVAAFEAALAEGGPSRHPHLVWLVMNAESGRAFAGEGTLAALAEALRQRSIPYLVVLTHAEPGPDSHSRLRARIAAVMGEAPVFPVNTLALRGEGGAVLMPAHGVAALWEASLPFLTGARREQVVGS
ncbi:GTPase [Muricoccus pecuniae]|uniref:Energy-coupling factor transporter ATP-binding protein EcfA2 n=1 Tax=Muricoccus pecuniae TaxID=693023 RepID=A0A840YE06_9PROT|nr:GTPase domain-containing protein [Roseomonas pecuniae]MBB5694607.1 energy-coupling factor transporter ATP-binding protein EcfA2 [Roseomonas pecuniae]